MKILYQDRSISLDTLERDSQLLESKMNNGSLVHYSRCLSISPLPITDYDLIFSHSHSTENPTCCLPRIKTIFGIKLPILPKKELLAYKRKLNRDVDKIDIKNLK